MSRLGAIAIVLAARTGYAQPVEWETLYREDAARNRASVEARPTPTIRTDVAPLPLAPDPYRLRAASVRTSPTERAPLFAADALPYAWAPDEPEATRMKSPFYVSEEASVMSAVMIWFLRKPSRSVVVLPTIGGGRIGLVVAGPLD